MATMKELRERCAQLGITPGRSIDETTMRILTVERERLANAQTAEDNADDIGPVESFSEATALPLDHRDNTAICLTGDDITSAVEQVVQAVAQPGKSLLQHFEGTRRVALGLPYGKQAVGQSLDKFFRSVWQRAQSQNHMPANPSKRQKELMYDIQGMLGAVVPHLAQSDAIMQPFMPASQQGHMLREGACREYGGVVSRFPRAGEHHV